MTYAAFLAVFLLLPIAGLLATVGRRVRRFHLIGGAMVCAIAFVYTTPWDNYAAARGLWRFAPTFVWGRPFWFGSLPLEEYLFYLCEAVFVCLAFIALFRLPALKPDADPADTLTSDRAESPAP